MENCKEKFVLSKRFDQSGVDLFAFIGGCSTTTVDVEPTPASNFQAICEQARRGVQSNA